MSDLAALLVILSVVVIAVSTWAIMYFAFRIWIHFRIKRDLGDMPSAEEICTWYEQNNAIIEYRKPNLPAPPPGRKLRS